jgi:XisI protein
MDNLKETVYEVVSSYAVQALNGKTYMTTNTEQNVFAVLFVGKFQEQHIADAGLIVRLEGDFVIVEQDLNSKIVLEALLQAGIPREKIILAYAGESLGAIASS